MGQDQSSLSSKGQDITVTYTKRTRASVSKRSTPEKILIEMMNKKKSLGDECQPCQDTESLLALSIDKHHDYIRSKQLPSTNLSDEMTWSEISSSFGTSGLLQDSYHSNSLTGDSGVDCHELSSIQPVRSRHVNDTNIQTPVLDDELDEDDDESFLNYSINETMSFSQRGPRRYDSDTALSRQILLSDSRK
jgi:hypothetical protein